VTTVMAAPAERSVDRALIADGCRQRGRSRTIPRLRGKERGYTKRPS